MRFKPDQPSVRSKFQIKVQFAVWVACQLFCPDLLSGVDSTIGLGAGFAHGRFSDGKRTKLRSTTNSESHSQETSMENPKPGLTLRRSWASGQFDKSAGSSKSQTVEATEPAMKPPTLSRSAVCYIPNREGDRG